MQSGAQAAGVSPEMASLLATQVEALTGIGLWAGATRKALELGGEAAAITTAGAKSTQVVDGGAVVSKGEVRFSQFYTPLDLFFEVLAAASDAKSADEAFDLMRTGTFQDRCCLCQSKQPPDIYTDRGCLRAA